MTFSKALLCGCTVKSIYSGFIETMQFVEKQHNLTLKALILCKIFWSNKISNANFLKKTNCKNITTEIKERRLRWLSHVLRRNHSDYQKSHKLDSTRKKKTKTPKDNLGEDGDNRAKIRWHGEKRRNWRRTDPCGEKDFFFYLLLKHISLHINNKTTILYIKHASINQNYKRFPTSKYNLLS